MAVSWSHLPSYLSYLWLAVRIGRSCERPLKEYNDGSYPSILMYI